MTKEIQGNVSTEFLLYKTPNDQVKVEVLLQDETIWLTQSQIGELFDTERSVITKHIKNIYLESELSKDRTCAKIARVQIEGERQDFQ